jgi:hypothetical protein
MYVIPSAGSRFGAVAQLGARLNRTQKVRGSNPLSSTKRLSGCGTQTFFASRISMVGTIFCSGFCSGFCSRSPNGHGRLRLLSRLSTNRFFRFKWARGRSRGCTTREFDQQPTLEPSHDKNLRQANLVQKCNGLGKAGKCKVNLERELFLSNFHVLSFIPVEDGLDPVG